MHVPRGRGRETRNVEAVWSPIALVSCNMELFPSRLALREQMASLSQGQFLGCRECEKCEAKNISLESLSFFGIRSLQRPKRRKIEREFSTNMAMNLYTADRMRRWHVGEPVVRRFPTQPGWYQALLFVLDRRRVLGRPLELNNIERAND